MRSGRSKARCLWLLLLAAPWSCRVGDLPKTTVDGSTASDAGGADSGVPWPDGSLGVGLPCARETSDEDCARLENPVCLDRFLNDALVYPGGYCSIEGCIQGACGNDAACVTLWTTSYCLKACVEDRDCREPEGYACKRIQDLLHLDAGEPDAATFCLPPDPAPPDASTP